MSAATSDRELLRQVYAEIAAETDRIADLRARLRSIKGEVARRRANPRWRGGEMLEQDGFGLGIFSAFLLAVVLFAVFGR